KVVDGLIRRGVEIIDHRQLPVHVSGHARRGEIRTLLRHARPEWFVPVHGEFHHLVAHLELAEGLGMPEDRLLLATDGDQVVLADEGLSLREEVTPGGYTFVHGDLTEDDHDVFRERLILGDEGVVMATVTADLAAGTLIGDVRVTSRGWLGDEHYDELTDQVEAELHVAVMAALGEDEISQEVLERRVRRAVGGFVNSRTGRRPMIVPLVTVV
ncbi:MAG: MBL fold metallo-hydrolase RNA specificity domain-containing protein, partial [Actinomycetota bacterium]